MSFSGPAVFFTVFLTIGFASVVITTVRQRTWLGGCMAALMAGLWIINLLNIPHIEVFMKSRLSVDSAPIKDLVLISLLVVNYLAWVVLGYGTGSRPWTWLRWAAPIILAVVKIVSWWTVRPVCHSPIGYEFDRCGIVASPLYALGEWAMYVAVAISAAITLGLVVQGRDVTTSIGRQLVIYISAFGVCLLWLVTASFGVIDIVLTGHLSALQLTLRPLLATVATVLLLLTSVLFPWYLATARAVFAWKMRPVHALLLQRSPEPDSREVSTTERIVDHLRFALREEGNVDDYRPAMTRESSRAVALWLLRQGPAPEELPLHKSRRGWRRWLLWVAQDVDLARRSGN